MPTQRYALDPNGPKRLEISWGLAWKNVSVKLDGNLIGTIPGQKELKAGQSFPLPDGSLLSVQLVQKFTAAELQILRNGQPLPGSASDPTQRHKVAYQIVFFIAGLNIVLGLIATVFQIRFLQAIGIGVFSIVFGLVFLALGFFVRRMSVAALILAIVIFALDGILGLIFAAQAGGNPSVAGIIVRVVLLIPMIQGVAAIRSLKQQTAGQPPIGSPS